MDWEGCDCDAILAQMATTTPKHQTIPRNCFNLRLCNSPAFVIYTSITDLFCYSTHSFRHCDYHTAQPRFTKPQKKEAQAKVRLRQSYTGQPVDDEMRMTRCWWRSKTWSFDLSARCVSMLHWNRSFDDKLVMKRYGWMDGWMEVDWMEEERAIWMENCVGFELVVA